MGLRDDEAQRRLLRDALRWMRLTTPQRWRVAELTFAQQSAPQHPQMLQFCMRFALLLIQQKMLASVLHDASSNQRGAPLRVLTIARTRPGS